MNQLDPYLKLMAEKDAWEVVVFDDEVAPISYSRPILAT